MCRLYGLQATHPTRPASDLIDAQNSLIRQSREDERGLSNPHGWGVGIVTNGAVRCERQVGPASESADFRAKVLQAEGSAIVAHVRRATIGTPSHENTHPFRDGDALLMHNGHIEAFDTVRSKILDTLPDDRARAIRGDTDSEHFFQLLRARQDEAPDRSRAAILKEAIQDVLAWSEANQPEAEVALNVLWVDDRRIVGSRLNRSLWYRRREAPYICPNTGRHHANPPAGESYRAYVVASERITDEDWTEIPSSSVFEITNDMSFEVESI